jgi:hypothetical protein
MPGLYDDDFLGFRIPSDEELDTAVREAVVAIDANVLLNLYRYRGQTTRDLLKVLKRLADRLVVPHQAVREFWRHRQRAPASPTPANRDVVERITKATRAMTQALDTWAKQVGLDASELLALVDRVESFADELRDELAVVQEHDGAEAGEGDWILQELEQLLDGRVTSALDEAELQRCVAEGQRRAEAEEPPGYKDAAKDAGGAAEGSAGDYLVWYQAMTHARERDSDLLIVTADEKEDWWWRQQGAPVAPRPELTLEYHTLTGRRLFLLRPPDLLTRAEALQVEVDLNSVADATEKSDEGTPSGRWTETAFFETFDRRDTEESRIAHLLLDWAIPRFQGIRWGYGKVNGSFYPRLFVDRPASLFVVYTNGLIEIRFGSVRELPPYDDAAERESLRAELNNIPGWNIPSESEKSYPTVPILSLRDNNALTAFTGVIEAAAQRIWTAAETA